MFGLWTNSVEVRTGLDKGRNLFIVRSMKKIEKELAQLEQIRERVSLVLEFVPTRCWYAPEQTELEFVILGWLTIHCHGSNLLAWRP